MPHRSTRCKLQSGTNYNNVLIDTEAGLQPLSPVRPAGIEISDVSCNNIELRKLFSNRFRSLSNDPVLIAITGSEHLRHNEPYRPPSRTRRVDGLVGIRYLMLAKHLNTMPTQQRGRNPDARSPIT